MLEDNTTHSVTQGCALTEDRLGLHARQTRPVQATSALVVRNNCILVLSTECTLTEKTMRREMCSSA